MKRLCDEQGEMPDPESLDEQAVEAILTGWCVTRADSADEGLDLLVEFARDVRAVTDRPVPRPSTPLAAVLSAGFSTDKGDLLVTAASNVNGPAAQAAGLPKWRKQHSMLPTGLLSGLVAKIVAGITAGLAGVTAVGAAGALPGPAQDAVANVIETVTPFNLPPGDASGSVGITVGADPLPTVNIEGGTGTPAAAGAAASASTGGASAAAGATGSTAGANANLTTPSVPGLSGIPGLSNLTGGLPGLSNLPVQIPQCVKDIVDVNTGQPKVALDQIPTQVVSCVRSLMSLSTAQVPAGISQCVNAILGMAGSIGASPGSVPNLTGIDFTKCVPIDVTKCMTSVMAMVQNFMPGGAFGFGGSAETSGANAGAAAGIPNLSGLNLPGCMPFNLDQCLSSIFSMAANLPGVGTGGIPGLGSGSLPSAGSLNLSACVPIGSVGAIPGLGNLSSFLPR